MSAPSPITDREATFRALLLAVFLAAAEATVVSTALPRIVADLGGLRLYGWAGSSYLLASTVTMPLFGRLADLHGRKPIFQIGLALFFAGSALCGWAFSFPMLLAGRVVQGLGAGSIQPVAMTLIGDLYPVEERARVQGIVGSIWAVAGVAGPLLGALLVEGPGWRWVFWVNLPFAAGSAFAIQRALHEPRREGGRAPLDLLGALLLVVAAVSLLLAAEGVAPLLTGNAEASRGERFLMHYPHSPHRSNYFTVFRDGDWKVIYHYFPTEVSGGSHYQLFNLKDDPFEQTDLAAAKPEELKRMMTSLIAGLEAQHAAYPVGDDGKTPVKPRMPE